MNTVDDKADPPIMRALPETGRPLEADQTKNEYLPAVDQRDLDAVAVDYVAPLAGVITILYLLLAALYALVLSPHYSWLMTGLALTSSVIAFSIFLAGRNDSIKPAFAHFMMTIMAFVVMANAVAHMQLTDDTRHSTSLILLFIGTGLFYLSRTWLALVYAATLGIWVYFIPEILNADDLLHYAFMPLGAGGLGIVTFIGRMRAQRRIIALRNQDRMREKLLQDALQRVQLGLAAERESKAKSDFLANMSHELRTPLNAIVGFSEIMDHEMFGKLENEQYKGYVKNIYTSGQHLISLVNDILDLSKVDVQMMSTEESLVDVDRISDGCLTLMSERAARNEVSIGYIGCDAVKAIFTDARRLKQILINLLSNAVKFTEPGGVVWLKTGVEEGCGVYFSVRDTGIGMTEEQLAQACMPFWQAESSLERKHEGTGLGLALVQEFAQLLGGHLKLSSAPGAGTTATVWFPEKCLRPPEAISEHDAAHV